MLKSEKNLSFDLMDIGQCRYIPALELQEELVAKRKAGDICDTLIIVEHEPVFTLGRNAKDENVLLPRKEIEKLGVDVVDIGRGGDVTYHGPGQIVAYPILDLNALGKGVLWYINSLEEIIINVLADFGITAEGGREDRGVWIGNEKIAALGVRITRGVTMHGFALNVKLDMQPYSWIVPCGIPDKGVTSMNKFKPDITIEEVKKSIVQHFKEIIYSEESKGN